MTRSRRAETVTAQRHHEVVVCVAMEVVAQVAIRSRIRTARVDGGVAEPAERVVMAVGVVDDREQHAPEVREQHPTCREEDLILDLDGVGRVEALARLVGVVREERARLAALDIGDPQRLPPAEDAGPVPAAADDLGDGTGGLGLGERSPASLLRNDPGTRCRPEVGRPPGLFSRRVTACIGTLPDPSRS